MQPSKPPITPTRRPINQSQNSSPSFSVKTKASHLLTADTVAGAYPPPPGVSLGEVVNICFSPPQPMDATNRCRSKYLAFLAPYFYPCKDNHPQNLSERKLCVLDLQPFWDYLERSPDAIPLPSNSHQHLAFAHQHVQLLLCPSENNTKARHGLIEDKGDTLLTHSGKTSLSMSPTIPLNSGISSSLVSTPMSSSSSTTCPPSNSKHGSSPQKRNPDLTFYERLRRERQRITISPNGMTQFSWTCCTASDKDTFLRILIPNRNSLYIQNGIPQWNSIERHDHDDDSLLNDESNEPVPIFDPLSIHWVEIYNSLQPPVSSITHPDPPKDTLRSRNQTIEEDSSPLLQRKRLYPEPNSPDPPLPRRKKIENNPCTIPSMDLSAIDPQLSPDGSMVAFVIRGDLYVLSCQTECILTEDNSSQSIRDPIQITFGAMHDSQISVQDTCHDRNHGLYKVHRNLSGENRNHGKRYGCAITHGLADFVAQEEMERYHGFWWEPNSKGILFTRIDESFIPPLHIMHHSLEEHESLSISAEGKYEEHRYPFAGEENAQVTLGYVEIDSAVIHGIHTWNKEEATKKAREHFDRVHWFLPPDESYEYLSSVQWLKDGLAIIEWQNRDQTCLLIKLLDVHTGKSITLYQETSSYWINLNHMLTILPCPINPEKYNHTSNFDQVWTGCPPGSFSFLVASERTGFCHIYLYTYIHGDESATLIRPITSGEWVVESIDGIDIDNNVVYVSGTYDSALEKHLYSVALLDPDTDFHAKDLRTEEGRNRFNFWQVFGSHGYAGHVSASDSRITIPRVPLRLTQGFGTHQVILDSTCRLVIDTYSDLNEPTSTKLFWLPSSSPFRMRKESSSIAPVPWMLHPFWTIYDPSYEAAYNKSIGEQLCFPPPEILSFTSTDPSCTLYAALYRPDPTIYGVGPYPLICSVYGGPRVQRVNRSWNQTIDLRSQRFCSLGFAVVKCDNRGSSRRGQLFEAPIKDQLGDIEVIDQVHCVRMLIMRGIADRARVGIYGWSYGGYLATMCLCRAPDIFHVAVAGAPVSDWMGYDTHYTERYLGLPSENKDGYRKSSVFGHIQNMKGRLMIVHGLIDENVHWRHSAYLINQLTTEGKPYDLCIFPDERHFPRKLKNRIYLERKISDYFLEHLKVTESNNRSKVCSSPEDKPFGRL